MDIRPMRIMIEVNGILNMSPSISSISREPIFCSIRPTQRNNRPLTGNGIREFAPAVGTGMLDATVCDIYLVDENDEAIELEIVDSFELDGKKYNGVGVDVGDTDDIEAEKKEIQEIEYSVSNVYNPNQTKSIVMDATLKKMELS